VVKTHNWTQVYRKDPTLNANGYNGYFSSLNYFIIP